MPAILPAVCCPRCLRKKAKKWHFLNHIQWLVPAKSCSLGEQLGGGLKSVLNQLFMPAAPNRRLTTCSPLADDTSGPSTTLPSNHHQKEIL